MKVTKNGIIKGMLLVALILSTTVAWAASTNVYIKPSSIFKEPGGEFILSIEVDKPAGIIAADITLGYDADVLEPVDVLDSVDGIQPASLTPLTAPELDPNNIDPEDGWLLEQNVFPGRIKIALAGSSPLSAPGAIVNVKLRVVDDAENGDISDIFFTQLELNEGSIEDWPHGSVVNVRSKEVDFVEFSGRITDSQGHGMPNLRVNLRAVPPPGAEPDFQPENFGDMTDENGDYSISARKDNEYNLSIQRFVNDVPAGFGVIDYGIELVEDMTGQDYTLYTISGAVTGSGPQPDIDIRSFEQTIMKPLGIGGRTDNNGNYKIFVVAGLYTVFAKPPQGSRYIIGKVEDVEVPLGTPGDRAGIDIELQEGWLLSGTVFGPDGTTKVKNVEIRVLNADAQMVPGIPWARTDDDGFYSVGLANGQYSLEVSPPPEMGIPPQQEPPPGDPPIEIADADVTYDITLQVQNVSFSGIVKADSDAGAPVADAHIWVHPRFPGPGYDTMSGADGGFTIADMNPGRYDLEVLASGFSFLRIEDVPIKQDITDYLIVLQSGLTVTGTVWNPDQTAGVPGTWLHFNQTDPWMNAGSVQTDEDGNYEIVLQPGNYHVDIEPPMESGFPRKTTNITVTEDDTEFDFVLDAGSLLTGRVLITGGIVGINDVNLAFHNVDLDYDVTWATTHYDEAAGDGFYSAVLSEGEYNIRVEPPEGSIFTVKVVKGIIVPREEPLDIILDTGVELSGYVFKPDGTGLPDVDVVARSTAPDIPERWTRTAPNGSYKLILVPGSYEVEVIPPTESGYVGQKKSDVAITSNVTDFNFYLVQGIIVEGIVSNPEGQPVRNVNVNVNYASPPNDYVAGANTDDEGHYKLTLLPGAYNINFEPDRGVSPDLIRREIHGLEVVSYMNLPVTLQRGVILWGYVTGSGPIENAWVNAHDPNSGYDNGSNTDSEGKYSIPLPPGTYDVWIDPPPDTTFLPKEIRAVQVPGPDPVQLDVVLETGFTVTGRIVVPDANNDDLSDNPGLKDVYVWLNPQEPDKHGRDDWTDEDGNFSMSVEAGMYTLEYEPPYGSVFVRDKRYDINVTGDLDLGPILLEVGAKLSGKVLKKDGTPVGGVEIAVRNAFTHEDVAWVWTEPNGYYSVALKPGSYQLEVFPPGMASFTVDVDVWEDTVKDIIIEERVSLSGMVTKANGEGVHDATIVAERITTGELIKSNNTDGNGYYEVWVPKGTYNLYCLPPDFFGLASEVVPGVSITSDTTQDFQLEAGATVTGKVKDSDGKVVVGAKIRFKDTTTGVEYKGVLGAVTNDQGAYIANVPYATYDVTAAPPVGSDLKSKTSQLEVDSFVEALDFTLETETETATISVAPTSGKPGDAFTVSGANFQAGETVVIDLGATSGIAQATVEADGTFSVNVTVDDQEPGIKTVTAAGSDSNKTATAQFEIEESGVEVNDWTAIVSASSDDFSVAQQILKFGVNPNAADVFDEDIDEAAPPTPPEVILEAIFKLSSAQEPNSSLRRLLTDKRLQTEETTEIIWDLRITAPENGFTISWDISAIPDTFTMVKLTEVATGAVTDMRTTSAQHFDANDTTQKFTITISKTTTIDVDVVLKSGWNMVSFAGELTDKQPSSLGVTSVFTYDAAGRIYVVPETIELGHSYWLLSLQDQTLTVNLEPATTYTIDLNGGWNMVGSVSSDVAVADVQLGTGSILSTYSYNAETRIYESSTTIQTNVGYWVLVLQDTTMTVTAGAVAAPVESPVTAQHVEPLWSVPMTLTGEDAKSTVVLGIHEKASDGFDPEFDSALPPLPIGSDSVSNAYFSLKNSIVGRLGEDIKALPSEGKAVWQLMLHAADESILTWDASGIAGVEISIYDGKELIDMVNASSHRFSAGDYKLTITARKMSKPMPKTSALFQNYPNPFNPETWMPYQLSKAAGVTIQIYDLTGRPVRTLNLGYREADVYTGRERAAYWNGRNNMGE